MTGSGFHKRCHLAYIPHAPRPTTPKHVAQNNHYEQCVEKDDAVKECYIQDTFPVKEKRGRETKQEKLIREQTAKFSPQNVVDCYIDSQYYNTPVTVDPVAKKSSTPIKKIVFNIPEDKPEIKQVEETRMNWTDYHRLSVIHKFMDDLEFDFPSLCTTGIIGTSVEGRNLKILKVSNSNASNLCVWLDAGIHAREWIAPAVNTYIADRITRNFDTLPECVRNKDWYFLPVVNPDGYEYSHTKDRMWRKNRAWHAGQCVGVDLNRNFGVGWGGKGSSDQPNNAFYRGTQPFSEPESAAMRDLFLNSGIKFKVYITLHSYGQIIIFPYACSSELAPDYVHLLEGATAMSKAIYNTSGKTYKVGISRDVMYGAAGTSNDFSYGTVGIPFCYLIELRSKKHKFRLPKEEIEETGNEILNCIIALMEFIDIETAKKNKPDKIVDATVQRADLVVESSELYLKRSDSNLRRSNSFILNKSDCGVNCKDSLVERDDFYVQKQEYFMQKDDAYVQNDEALTQNDETCRLKNDIYLKKDNQYIPKNNTYVQKANTYVQKTEIYVQKENSDVQRDATYQIDTYQHRNNSYEQKNCFYVERTDSYVQKDRYFVPIDRFIVPNEDYAVNTTDSYENNTNTFERNLNAIARADDDVEADSTEGQRNFVKTLDTVGAINIWKEERSSMDIMVEGPRSAQVAGMLHEREIPYSIAIPDITTMLEREHGSALSRNIRRNSTGFRPTMDWKAYHRLDTIYAFMDNLASEYPYLCQVSVIGKSVEGRDLKMLKISNGNDNNSSVWLDGTIHPREWVSPAVVTFLADRIVRTFNELPSSVTNKDWYILPVMNPDGYEYTHTHDRMWRKNRARYGECVGVDLNRNFSYGFGEKGEEGSSNDPGNIFYRGPKAFSEPETAAVRRVIMETDTTFKAFLSFHSYGEVIIFPWGYTSEPCPDYVELLEGGTAMAKAIFKTNGNTYRVGSTKDLMYYAAGTSIDWSYAVANIPYSYMIELRGKTHRFLLPKEEIMSTAIEVLNGVLRLMDFVDRRCTGTQACVCPK